MELEAAARLLRAGGGGSATLESGEEAAARFWRAERRLWSLSAEETRSPFEKTQLYIRP